MSGLNEKLNLAVARQSSWTPKGPGEVNVPQLKHAIATKERTLETLKDAVFAYNAGF